MLMVDVGELVASACDAFVGKTASSKSVNELISESHASMVSAFAVSERIWAKACYGCDAPSNPSTSFSLGQTTDAFKQLCKLMVDVGELVASACDAFVGKTASSKSWAKARQST
jgi:hypothetical protein